MLMEANEPIARSAQLHDL